MTALPAALFVALWTVQAPAPVSGQDLDRVAGYEVEAPAPRDLRQRYSDAQLAVLEKLNRTEVGRLQDLPALVVPARWVPDELAYSPAPMRLESASAISRALVVHQAGQFFAAYEQGHLVRWGPVSTGGAASVTPSGLFHLTWRSPGRPSTVNPEWFLEWSFNFENRLGLSLHAYALSGLPASHGCIRLLERDARWLYEWGEGWSISPDGERVLTPGTPLWIVGRYDFSAPPPWRSLDWLAAPVELPPLPADAVSAAGAGGIVGRTAPGLSRPRRSFPPAPREFGSRRS